MGKCFDYLVIDVGARVQFSNMADYDLALTGGPCLLFDHYLAVQPWKPDFDPEKEKISSIAAWIFIDN